MIQTLSHTFKFQTPDTSAEHGLLENIITITQEDSIKHYVQYMQYWTTEVEGKKNIQTRQVNIKVDRLYYLEIANICIDDFMRRGYFFAILGRRRFGSNSKRLDFYLLNKNLNTDTLEEIYNKLYGSQEFKPSYTETTSHSTNSYKTSPFDMGDNHIIFLDQLNTSKRKDLHKTFIVELSKQSFENYKLISSEKEKINYLFNKIGKIHFKSLEIEELEIEIGVKDIDSIAESKLQKSNLEIERAAKLNENSLFRRLKDKSKEVEAVYFDLYNKSNELMKNPSDDNTIHLFSISVLKFEICMKDIYQLEEIMSHLTTIQMLAESGNIAYILTKHDQDFKDIFFYALESLSSWNKHISNQEENVYAFNVATIDLQDSLRYLVDICFKFKHEYQCAESHTQKQGTPKEDTFTETIKNTKQTKTISASEFFEGLELDNEVYEELLELEHDINEFIYTTHYNEDLNEHFIHFLKGYTSALNPLFEFKDLSYSFMLLAQNLQDADITKNGDALLTLVQDIVSNILEWKKTVLIEKTANDIHYMNSSFYSSIMQIEIAIGRRAQAQTVTKK
ncbi:hypothetical protein GJV85_00580 [Sulfurimonas aquatica]|uniref:Uncharacterized protein n=1 Tax=Sulfurimonas aquatica TaxID=2672570 RepID=A0A975AY79_9BACT|nr:hypothetical protein [Sulfurimonas aquatica]QSZ40675.1 hypothetical protein GJV85_00580 [Sulfurimonas aquatica]